MTLPCRRFIGSPGSRWVWGAALGSALSLGAVPAARAEGNDRCEDAPELYATCKMIMNLEKFSEAAAAKERWEATRDFASSAIHAIDYLLRKLGDPSAQALLRDDMTARRAALETRRIESDARSKPKEPEPPKEEESRRSKVLVDLHFPASSPDVYVNGAKATGPVYVPRGPIILGVGQNGGRYDVGAVLGLADELDVQVGGTQRGPAPEAAWMKAPEVEMRRFSFEASVAPIFGMLRGTYRPLGLASRPLEFWFAGLRIEAALPEFPLGESGIGLRPFVHFSTEYSTNTTAEVYMLGIGGGLKLQMSKVLDFDVALAAGYQRFGAYRVSPNALHGASVPELSLGAAYPFAGNRNGPGMLWSVGLCASAGLDHAEYTPRGAPASAHSLYPYFHGGLFLRFRYETSRRIAPAAPSLSSEMASIKGGPVLVGSNDGRPGEPSEHLVLLMSFEIDVREVTVAQYRACVAAGYCSPPEEGPGCNWSAAGRDGHPINCVTRAQASTFCERAGKRLPTESEWERAAGGAKHWKYPWGVYSPTAEPCWSGQERRAGVTCESGSHPQDQTPDGVYDMAGNVSEWTLCDDASQDCRKDGWVARGGHSSSSDPRDLRSSARSVPTQPALHTVGFRCAR